ncbi:MAG: cell division protein FtsZ, partial [Gammaproteobacteria bacterium]|nr:cell division protein FtsZ [Gammaproteobacteria bacterium]
GVGGGGTNAVKYMIDNGTGGVNFVCMNTDSQTLEDFNPDKIIRLGKTGLGAGSNPEEGRALAEEAKEEIQRHLHDTKLLFITAGMGGGTGTGAAPVLARIAREMNILTVAVVTKPFSYEGQLRSKVAEDGLKELEANVDSLIVVLNDKLLDEGEDIGMEEAFEIANDVLRNSVGGIAEIINVKGKMNVDFNDVCSALRPQGKAIMGTGFASGPDRSVQATLNAISCPMVEGVNLANAEAVLVLISSTKETLKLNETKKIAELISKIHKPHALVKYGTFYNESLGEAMRVTVVATGLKPAEPQTQVAPKFQVLKPGSEPAPQRGFAKPESEVSSKMHTEHHPNQPAPQDSHFTVLRSYDEQKKARENLLKSGVKDIDVPAFLRKLAS